TGKARERRGHHGLFVCPTYKLATNYKEHGCTINKLFGIGLTEGTNMAKFDDSGYDGIVFDEIFFCSVRNLAVALDPREVPYGAESYLVEYYGVVAVVVELRHIGALREPYAEEFVDGAAVLFVEVCPLVL
ncbi:MAG: hypothetical protein ACKPKO_10075, partial [Candidatus Fonsibacter sp.]